MSYMPWQLQNYDICIARNNEALRIQPRFVGCYGNMANACKVTSLAFTWSVCYFQRIWFYNNCCLIVQYATTWLPLRFCIINFVLEAVTLSSLFSLSYTLFSIYFSAEAQLCWCLVELGLKNTSYVNWQIDICVSKIKSNCK